MRALPWCERINSTTVATGGGAGRERSDMTAGGEAIDNDRCLAEHCDAGCFLMMLASVWERRVTRVLLIRSGAKAAVEMLQRRRRQRWRFVGPISRSLNHRKMYGISLNYLLFDKPFPLLVNKM